MPGEGCSEHSFLLRSLMEDARRNHKSLYSIWFDLKNAFGSIPHDLLWFSMRVPGEIIDVVRDIYQGSSFRVLSGDNNMTDSIPQARGVKQGCPLSPLIFNIAIEGLLRGIMSCPAEGYSFGKGFEVKSLAYADDLTIVAKTDAAIRAMIARIEEFASWAGLCFNVTKCASLSTGYMSGKRIVFPSTFTLNGNTIPVMKWEDRYRHLGVLLGANPEAHLDHLAKDFKMDVESLFQSPLADWMKLEAFKEFVMPKLDYVFRTTLAHKKWAKLLDRHVRSSVKRSLGLPQRTCDAFFYTSMSSGGLGLRCIEDDLGSLMITQAVKMLTSPDPLIREMAQHSLNLTIQKRCGGVEGPEDRWRYLYGQLSRVKKHSDVSTIWSRVKAFCSDRNIRLCGGCENCPPSSITMADQVLDSHLRENLLRRLRDGRAKHWLHRWTSLAEQGGLAHTFSKTPESNYWLRDCKYLRYREYRFAVKARLNQLPVASQKLKLGKPVNEAYCKGCGSSIETQEHCLSVCKKNMPAMKDRHDKIVNRLVKAIPDRLGTKYLDQCVPDCEGLLRPDIVILNSESDTSKKAYLVDVAVPCETGDNLKVSRDRKRERYSAIRAKLEERGYETLLDGFIIGTLGTWVSENDTVLKQLGIGRKYEPLFKRLCCRDAIAGSYSVWASRNRLHAQLGRTNQRH